MKKFDIVITGDCNLDLIFNQFNRLPGFGEEIIANQFELALGSSAGIVAAHMASLGAKVAYVGAIGNDHFGNQFKAFIQSYGVCTDYMVEKTGFKTGCTVVMSKDEDRANLTHAGAMAELSPSDLPWQLIEKTPFFHLSNPYVLPHFRNNLPDLYKKLKEANTVTSLDPQWDVEETWNTNLKALFPFLDYFLPNEKEFELLLAGNSVTPEALSTISTTTIIKTCGSAGIEMLQSDKTKQYTSYLNEQPVDCIGAGDAFTAGFLTATVEGKTLDDAIDLGSKAGALSTTTAGGKVPYNSRQDFADSFNKLF
ncbi:carbohydrate kinase family protein [Carboxylicivirga sp. RSCT41]|uniref:carbohydrate kinase family protein n=1 Tax=Carboxylicivirga agarovorans TaxID=3417570 RepID=UPI003D341532